MATFLQQDRPLQLQTVLGPDKLFLRGFTATEAVSRPFRFVLDLMSDDPALDGGSLLRTHVQVMLSLPDRKQRSVHGWISRFVQLGQHEEMTFYRAEVVPRLWFLGLSRDCRIFQQKTVPQIVEEVLTEHGVQYKLKVRGQHPAREYCVQYRESDLDFISRLMEEEGIFYFFDHGADQETLVIADANSAVPPCPDGATARMAPQGQPDEDVVLEIHREFAVHSSKVTLKAYDYLQPALSLSPSVDATVAGWGEEVYDYSGVHTSEDEGYRQARLLVEADEAREQQLNGKSSVRALASGTRFKLHAHFNLKMNDEFMLLEVRHEAHSGEFRTGGVSAFHYSNEFVAIPFDVPYRPERTTSKPVVPGSQTAVVVGPAGEEVYTDKHARVKVQFYWDRLGKRDENSSCWLRVAQPWAGKGWGAASLPRIGNEVVVQFLDGDPDRPIIIGSVYNADQTPPFELPGAGIQMGMKSRSSPGGGGHNEISMTDTKGKEGFTVHAQYNLNTTVLHDETHTVKTGKQTVTVKGDAMLTVQSGNRVVAVSSGHYVADAAKQVYLHGKAEGLVAVGEGKGATIIGKGGAGAYVYGEPNVVASGKAKAGVTAPDTTVEGKDHCFVVGKELRLQGDSHLYIVGPDIQVGDGEVSIMGKKVTISGPAGSITLDPSGVTITGALVKIN